MKKIIDDLLTRAFTTDEIFTSPRPTIGTHFIRMITPSCWREVIVGTDRRLAPCSDEECCIVEYDCAIMKDHYSYPPATHVVVINQANDLLNPPCPPHVSPECDEKCDEMKLTEGRKIGPYSLYDPTSIEYQSENEEIAIKPNPTSNILSVGINDKLNTNVIIEIYSIEGVQIIKQEFENEDITIDVSKFSPSYYILILKFNGRVFYEKIIIQE